MNAPFPHHYEVNLASEGGLLGKLSAGPRPPFSGGPPPEFGGDDQRWSPEHLLLASVSLCLMTTFAAITDKSKLDFSAYESRAEGILDKTPEGLRFTRVTLTVTVRSGDALRAARLLEMAKKHCIVSNSLRVPIEVEGAFVPI